MIWKLKKRHKPSRILDLLRSIPEVARRTALSRFEQSGGGSPRLAGIGAAIDALRKFPCGDPFGGPIA